MADRVGQSVVVAGIITAVAAAAVAGLATVFPLDRGDARGEGGAVADAVAASVSRGDAPEPLLRTLAAAGAIRSAVVYDRGGASRARIGNPGASAELDCRSLPDGGSLCVETAAAAGRGTLRQAALASGSALLAALAVTAIGAAFMLRAFRAQLLAVRAQADEALRNEMQAREALLRRRTTELENANKDLESFASAVSHDLRAPLGSILGFSQALEEDYLGELDDVGRECVQWIRSSAQQMQQLLDGLMQMARISRTEVQREQVDLSAMAREVAAALQHAHPDRAVDFHIADGVVASGDERLLRAVMENLIGNAWKFTSKRDAARIEVGVRHDDGAPAYYVRDNGAGFDSDHAAKMFRPFQRLHSEKEFSGTGIGLATVQTIVQRHGGRTWAEGEPGRGATIYFTIGSPQEASL